MTDHRDPIPTSQVAELLRVEGVCREQGYRAECSYFCHFHHHQRDSPQR